MTPEEGIIRRTPTMVVWVRKSALLCWIALSLSLKFLRFSDAACVPPSGCDVALAYYIFNTTTDGNISTVATRFPGTNVSDILLYSHLNNTQPASGDPLHIPFTCGCAGTFLNHNFSYTVVTGDTATTIASTKYQYLTTVDAVQYANNKSLDAIFPNNVLSIPINCSCGDPNIETYGLFLTYVAREDDNADVISKKFNVSIDVLQSYNPNLNFNLLTENKDIIFVPATDGNGTYPRFKTTDNGSSNKTSIAIGASVGAFVLLLIVGLALFYALRNHPRKQRKLPVADKTSEQSLFAATGFFSGESEYPSTTMSSSFSNFVENRSVEFSYEELSAATDNFSIAKKIGQGGYGSVYYGELRGQKLAIKKMDTLATKEFVAELKVLTRVHHTNLVRLVGYCANGSLFLVYEYVDNGTLSQHLRYSRGEAKKPLSWTTRIQIALDAARGLEYIHEHTTPTYIHRDIKSSNILIDKSFRAKVADFGLTKLTEGPTAGNSAPSRIAGTFGYMAPEYARFGDISTKADVYSFGVVLFEMISAKNAIVQNDDASLGGTQGLAILFENVLNDPDNGKELIRKLVDPNLGNDYPLDSIWKMANLAGACTREEPMLRPNMRMVVVALMGLLSSPQDGETDRGMESLLF